MKILGFKCRMLGIAVVLAALISETAAADDSTAEIEVNSFAVKIEKDVSARGEELNRLVIQFPAGPKKIKIDDVFFTKLVTTLKEDSKGQATVLSACGLSYWTFKKLMKRLDKEGLKFSQTYYDPPLYQETVQLHANLIMYGQGLLGLLGWNQAYPDISFWRGAGFVFYQAGVAWFMTKNYTEVLKQIRSHRAEELPLLSIKTRAFNSTKEMILLTSINFATLWVGRLITGKIGEASPVLEWNHGLLPHLNGRGNLEVLSMALLAVFTQTLLSVRDNRILERELSNELIQENYARILKSYANVARFGLFSWAFLCLQVGIYGPTLWQLTAADGKPFFKLSSVDAIVVGGSLGLWAFSMVSPRLYFKSVELTSESSQSVARAVKNRCRLILSRFARGGS